MDAQQMMRQCKTVLKQLERLEGHINAVPKKDVAKFVFQSIQEIKELYHIARFETAITVTPEQAAHVTKIVNRVTAFMRMLPDDVKKELGGE